MPALNGGVLRGGERTCRAVGGADRDLFVVGLKVQAQAAAAVLHRVGDY